MSKQTSASLYLRNFLFGVEDSLVSTSGLLSGVAAAGLARNEIFLSGVVLIFVEAFSMGAGSFLSEQSADELLNKRTGFFSNIYGAVIMFVSYFISGFIPLAPYIFLEVSDAFKVSIGLSLVSLFLLGIVSAKFFSQDMARFGLRMLVVGGLAIMLGIFAGEMFKLPM